LDVCCKQGETQQSRLRETNTKMTVKVSYSSKSIDN
jgi:hypothetical protein